MEAFYQFIVEYGVLGFFFATFLAGSFIPFSSEVVMVALITAGVDPISLFIWGTIGNTLGSVFNYWLGRMGNPRWIEKWARVTPEQLAGYGNGGLCLNCETCRFPNCGFGKGW